MPIAKLKFARRTLALLGPLILLLAWASQQFFYDKWNGKMSRLDSAEAVWDIYRSNHYIFNTLRPKHLQTAPATSDHPSIHWQLRNLKVGAERLEALISPEILKNVQASVNDKQDGGFGGPDGMMDIRFKVLERALFQERAVLRKNKEQAQALFWALYAAGALITYLATILKESIDAKEGK